MGKSGGKQAETKPYDKRKQLELILSSLNTGLALINKDFTIAWVNEVTRSILPWDDLTTKR